VDDSAATEAPLHQGVLGRIARSVVQVHSRFYGRGPTKAKAIWRDEIVCVILEDLYTQGEKLLIGAGKFEQVRASRVAFQDEVEPLLRAEIEAITGRRTRGFTSQVSIDNLGAEVFVLDIDGDGHKPGGDGHRPGGA